MKPIVLHLRQSSQLWGADRYIVNLVKYLPKEGYEVEVVLLDKNYAQTQAKHPLTEFFQKEAINFQYLNGRLFWIPQHILQLIARVRKNNITLLHSHEFKSDIIGAIISKITGIPHIVTDHGQAREDLLLMRVLRSIGLKIVKSARRIIAPSHHQKQLLVQAGFSPAQITVIPNGVNSDSLGVSKQMERSLLRQQFGLHDTDTILISTLRLDPQKDHKTMLKAFALVVQQTTNVYLWIVGDGEPDWQAELKALAAQLNIVDKIKFLGYRTDIHNLLIASDIFVSSSLLENAPYSLLEAMAFARPIVATIVGGVPELIKDGVSGLLIPAGDAPAMAQALLTLIKNPTQATALGLASKQSIDTLFNAKVMSKQIAAIYTQSIS